MKKSILFSLACMMFAGSVMANVSSSNANRVRTNQTESKKPKPADRIKDDQSRNFHVMPVSGEKSKLLLTIGKKPNTKVHVKIYDKSGRLVYSQKQSSKKDFAQVLNVEEIEGASITISDNNGIGKSYSF